MASSGKNRVLVIECVGQNEWNAVEADVGTDSISVRKAVSGTGPNLDGCSSISDMVLVSNSPTAVCRLLNMADAPQDATESMVALRLETELPYPAEDSTWACQRKNGATGNGAQVLVIATETGPLDQNLEDLKKNGRRCAKVEFDGTAFADLAFACAGDDETAAIAVIGETGVTLVIIHAGALHYMRRFSVRSGNLDELANELDQTLYDYTFRTNKDRPDHLFLAGTESDRPGLQKDLGKQLNIEVETAELPHSIDVESLESAPTDLLTHCPACVGALLSIQRRLQKGTAAGPPLIAVSKTAEPLAFKKRLRLAVVSAALFVLLVALSFAVRTAQINAAEQVIDEGRSMLRDIELLEEEVDILKFESERQRPMLDVLVPLTEVLPKGVKVVTLGVDRNGTVTISGIAKSVEDISDKTISAMEDSNVFLQPRFQGATKEKEGYSFRMTCKLRRNIGGSS